MVLENGNGLENKIRNIGKWNWKTQQEILENEIGNMILKWNRIYWNVYLETLKDEILKYWKIDMETLTTVNTNIGYDI